MLNDFFLEQVLANFPFEPTQEQRQAFQELNTFLFDRNPDTLFLLKGYAGTGKSSLLGTLVKTMTQLGQKTVLLAPTGRAAKVFSSYAEAPAYTIHKKIYRQKIFSNEPTGFVQADNLHKHTLFLVDEASMISNDGLESFSFGTGRLLDDLIHYVYSGDGCRLVLIGDSAQLPPVSQPESPALDPDILKGYGMELYRATLTQVVRQAEESGILKNATALRTALDKGLVKAYPKIETRSTEDIQVIGGNELIEAIEDAYYRDGQEETIVISRSNKRANVYNNGIRNRILDREEELEGGDILMVAKNNYFWSKEEKAMDFIANGDMMRIRRVRRVEEMYGFRFADVTVLFPDYDLEMDIKILLNTLNVDSPSLPKEANDQLFYTILEDYADIPDRRGKMKKMKEDPYYNAVQVKYGYAVTGHKAQGGQWKTVFLDISFVPEEFLGIDFYRWLYTAITRATDRLYLVNPPQEFLESPS